MIKCIWAVLNQLILSKNWVDIDISSRILQTLEYKEAVGKLGTFTQHDCLFHHLKGINVNV